MADLRRLITTSVNTDRANVATAENFDREQDIKLYRKTEALFLVDLISDDPSVEGGFKLFKPELASVWAFNIDNTFDPTSSDLVASDDSQFNIAGDRSDLDVANGKISFRVATTSTALETALGVDAGQDMTAELWMTPPGVTSILLAQFTINMRNVATDIGETTELVFTQSNVVRFDGDDTIILFPDGGIARRFSPE